MFRWPLLPMPARRYFHGLLVTTLTRTRQLKIVVTGRTIPRSSPLNRTKLLPMVVLVGSISRRATFVFSRKVFQTVFHVLPSLTLFHPFSPYLRYRPASCYALVSFMSAVFLVTFDSLFSFTFIFVRSVRPSTASRRVHALKFMCYSSSSSYGCACMPFQILPVPISNEIQSRDTLSCKSED
jgi:hypothetical protein